MSRHATLPPQIAVIDDGADVCARAERNQLAGEVEIGLDQEAISALISFFRTLDEWDREANLQ